MKRLFLPYNLALLAKEKEFDEDCFAFYFDGELQTDRLLQQYPERCVNAPLYQQIIDWFREKHKLEVSIYHEAEIGWWASVNDMKTSNTLIPNEEFKNYYTALNHAFKKAFKLI